MNFVADENIERQIIERLESDGHSVVGISRLRPGIPDEEVLAISVCESSILITSDKDFGHLVYRQGKIFAGVILLRLAYLSAIEKSERVARVVVEHGLALRFSFSVVSEKSLRIRVGPAN